MAIDNRTQLAARQWVDSLERKWRLQILSRRYRVDNRTGETKELPTRIRRFVEGMPIACAPYAIGYLLSKAPYKGIIYNGVEIDGEYRPTLTTWQRDDRETVNGTSRTDGTYTLIQDLTEKTLWDSLTAQTSRSCSEEVYTEWVWDAPDVGELPVTGNPQGHTYAIQSVNRNEDGTFNYAIVDRRAITKHTENHVQSDTAIETVSVESWDNVYGSEEEGWTDESGTPITIPVSMSAAGTTVSTQVQKNDDCTYRISIETKVSKPVVNGDDSTHTQYEGDHTEQHLGSPVPLGTAPDARNGVIKSFESQLQPDGSYRTVEKTKVERSVPESMKQISVGRRGRRVTVVNTNQASAPNMSSIATGGSVKYEKTPGRRYTTTTVTWDHTNPTRSAESCTEDIFHHQHSGTTSGIENMPLDTDHVKDSGKDGLVVSRQTDMDEEGSISQTVTRNQEIFAPLSEESWSVGLTGLTHTVKHRNVSPNKLSYYGTVPSFSKHTVGTTLTRSKTPGGLYDVTMSSLDRSGADVDSGVSCSKTAFLHTDSSAANRADGALDTGHVPEASGGVYYETNARLNQDGSSTVTTQVNTEIPERNAEVSYRRTPKGLVTTVTHRNVTDSDFSAPKEDEIGSSASKTMTNGHLYNITTTSISANTVPDHSACTKTVFEHHHDNVTMGVGAVDDTDVDDAGSGVYHQKSSDLDESGFVRTTDRVVTELPVSSSRVQYSSDYFTKTSSVTDKNQVNTALTQPDFVSDGAGTLVSYASSVNNGGSVDITTDTVTAKFRSWDHEVDTNWRYSKTVWFTNASKSEKDNLYSRYASEFTTKLGPWMDRVKSGSQPAPSRHSIQPNVSMNKFGLYDGSFTFSADWDTETAGKDGSDTDVLFFYFSYTEDHWSYSAGASGSSAHQTKVLTQRDITFYSGRGVDKLGSYVSGQFNLNSGTSARIDPTTKVWNATICRNMRIDVQGQGSSEEN